MSVNRAVFKPGRVTLPEDAQGADLPSNQRPYDGASDADRHAAERAQRVANQARNAPRTPPELQPKAAVLDTRGIPFETALTFLKLGYRAQRAGWNGKGMWIAVQVPDDARK